MSPSAQSGTSTGISNATLVTAIMIYGLAMLAYACDFAFGEGSRASAPAVAPAEQVSAAALVGARSGADLAGHSFPADPADLSELADLSGTQDADGEGDADLAGAGAPAPLLPAGPAPLWPRSAWLRGAFVLACAGLVFHIAAITARGIAEDRVPWGNMYEFIAAITCAAVLVLVVASVKFRAYFMGLFVLLPVVIALVVTWRSSTPRPANWCPRCSPTGSLST